MKQGRKFWIAVLFGVAMIGVLVLLLAFGVRDTAVLLAWLAAFAAIPTQFSVTNAAVSRAYASAGKSEVDDGK